MASKIPGGPPGLKLTAMAPWFPMLIEGCVVAIDAVVGCCPASLAGISPRTPPTFPTPSAAAAGGIGATGPLPRVNVISL
jgi:hypothetical protein